MPAVRLSPPRTTAPDTESGTTPYAVPALEKGLDILEALAEEPDGLALSDLARRLEKSRSEIFRMVDCLKQRGYIRAHPATEKMTLSLRLFELAHKTPVTRRLLAESLPLMKTLAREVGQSCHLAVCSGCEMLVMAMVNSDRPMEFSVREGTRVGLLTSSSGRIYLAFQVEAERTRLLRPLPRSAALRQRAAGVDWQALATAGFESVASDFVGGVTNMSCPIRDVHGHAIASLTVPYLEWHGPNAAASPKATLSMLLSTSEQISQRVLAG